MPKSLPVKKGDHVRVIAGKDKGAEGKILAVLVDEQRVIVEGVNQVKKHTKLQDPQGRAGYVGGIVTAEAPIHVSNVQRLEGGKPVRSNVPRKGEKR